MHRVFKLYSDSGHGWLAVKVMDLFDTCTAHKISNYSYIRGLTAYLEEDIDAGIFIANWRELHDDFKYEAKYVDGNSVIRSYDRYSIQQAEQIYKKVMKY
jgi:hypothetical protein